MAKFDSDYRQAVKSLDDPDLEKKVLRKAARENWSVQELKDMVRALNEIADGVAEIYQSGWTAADVRQAVKAQTKVKP